MINVNYNLKYYNYFNVKNTTDKCTINELTR